jgi:hypothetical protein
MGIRLQDLPPEVRKQVEATHGLGRGRPSRREIDGPGLAVQCHACREVFPTYRGWERHAERTRHNRCDLIIEQRADDAPGEPDHD